MAEADVPKTCKVVMAETISKSLLGEVTANLQQLQENGGGKPSLVAFLANDDPAAAKYAEWSKKTCEDK
jgi:methylenetetrahydrofolate dehydrogenase (NAD+)